MGMRWLYKASAAFGVAVAGLLMVGAGIASACLAPSLQLSQPYALAGSGVSLTGATWTPQLGQVTIHWGSATGPVLATVMADNPDGVLGPVSIRIPAGAAPGYDEIVATTPADPGRPAHVTIQVLAAGMSPVQGPGALLPSGRAAQPVPVGTGVGAISLLAALAGAGLVLGGVGVGTVARIRRRAPVGVPVSQR